MYVCILTATTTVTLNQRNQLCLSVIVRVHVRDCMCMRARIKMATCCTYDPRDPILTAMQLCVCVHVCVCVCV